MHSPLRELILLLMCLRTEMYFLRVLCWIIPLRGDESCCRFIRGVLYPCKGDRGARAHAGGTRSCLHAAIAWALVSLWAKTPVCPGKCACGSFCSISCHNSQFAFSSAIKTWWWHMSVVLWWHSAVTHLFVFIKYFFFFFFWKVLVAAQ